MRKTQTDYPDIKALKIKFSILQLAFWCSWCAFTSFAALYFKHEGMSDSQTGFALSLSALFGIPGQAVLGFLCDRCRTVKKIFFSANIIIWVVVLSFLFIRSPIAVMILMSILGFTQVPQPAILDAWILKKMPGREDDYGHIRLWASFGFAASALLFGRLIGYFGFTVMFVSASIFLLITLVVSLSVPDVSADYSRESGRKHIKDEYMEIARNRPFLFLLIIGFIIGLAARTTHILLPLILEKVNGNAANLGTALFLTGIAEIPMLIASKRLLKRFQALSLILISVFLYLGQFTLLYFAQSPTLVFFAMILQGLAFGNYLPSVRLFVNNNAPGNLRTSAQTLTDMITSGLAGMIGSAAGGVIIQNSGTQAVILLCLVITVAAGIILFLKRSISR